MQRVAVIGLGNISHRHRRNLKILYPESKIIAVSAREEVIKELPENVDYLVSSIEGVLSLKPQLAVVASPANLHLTHAKRLIEADVPCLIEKPLSINYEEAEEFINFKAGSQIPCAVGYCLRYMPTALKMRQLIKDDVLGEVYNISIAVGQYLPEWRKNIDYRKTVSTQKQLGGGALLELSHELDYANWLFGPLKPLHSVLRSSKKLNLDVEDLVDLVLATETGSLVNIHLDFLQRTPQRYCTVIGANGSIHWDLIKNTIDISLKDKEQYHVQFKDWQANDMYLDMLKDFENLCTNKPHSTVDLVQAARTLKLIDKVREISL